MAAAKAASQFSMVSLNIANQQGANSFALFR